MYIAKAMLPSVCNKGILVHVCMFLIGDQNWTSVHVYNKYYFGILGFVDYSASYYILFVQNDILYIFILLVFYHCFN